VFAALSFWPLAFGSPFRFGQLLITICRLLFLVPRFSAVLDFGQKLADAFDVLVCPDVNRNASSGEGLRGRDLARNYVITKRRWEQTQLLGGLAR